MGSMFLTRLKAGRVVTTNRKMKEKSSERVRLQIQQTCQTVRDMGRVETNEKYC